MLGLIRKNYNKTTPAFALTVDTNGACALPKDKVLLLPEIPTASRFGCNGKGAYFFTQ